MTQRMTRRLATGAATLALFLLAGGCAPARNEKFTPENVAKVQEGVGPDPGIALAEVEALLGPGDDYRPPGGDDGLRWKRWEREKDGDSLAVGFGADGRAIKSEYRKWDKSRGR